MMLKTTKNTAVKHPTSSAIFNLTINSIKFHQQHIKSISQYISFSIFGINDQLLKETPIISLDSPQIWNFTVNVPNPKIMLFSELDHTKIGVRRKQLIGAAILDIDRELIGLYSARNKAVLVCDINYELIQQKRNRFINNSDIFSDVEQQPLKQHKKMAKANLDMTYERKIYHEPDSIIIDQQRHDSKTKKGGKNIFDASEDKTLLIKVQQASRILQQSMRTAEQQRKMFSKYLDDSTSYVNELMKNYDKKQSAQFQRILDFSTINEDKNEQEQQISTQQKWYTRKFHKNHIKQKSQLRKQKVQSKQSKLNEQPKKANISYIDQNYVTRKNLKKMISDLVVDVKDKPKQINFATIQDGSQNLQVFVKMVKEDGLGSNLWRVNVPVNLDKGLQITCVGEREEVLGCIGKQQEKQGKCPLFDNAGNMKGMLHFKCKEIGQTIVQTQYIIPTQIDLVSGFNKDSSNNQTYFSALKSKNQRKLQQRKKQKESKKHSKKQQLLKVNNVVPQLTNQQFETDSNLENNKKIEQIKKENKSKPELASIQSHSPNTQTSSPIKKLQQLSIQQQQEYSGSKTQFSLQNHTPFSQEMRKLKNSTDLKYQSTNGKDSSLSIGSKTKINSMRLPPYVPFKQKTEESKIIEPKSSRKHIKLNQQQEQNTQQKKSIVSEPLHSLSQSNFSLKINNADVRLNKPNYSGKFLKLQINGEAVPYYTETSKQLYLLTWKGKGYLFMNIAANSVLKVSLLQETDGVPQQLGSCQINISQLKLNYSGYEQCDKILTNKNGQQIGKLILIYQFFSKKSQQLQSLMESPSSSKKKINSLKQSKTYVESSRYKYKSSRLATSTAVDGRSKIRQSVRTSGIRIKSQQKKQVSPSKIQLHDYIFDRLKQKNQKLSESSLRFRKYLGGNIIIPKAARFKTAGDQESAVGPGAYQYPSQFERHAIQL